MAAGGGAVAIPAGRLRTRVTIQQPQTVGGKQVFSTWQANVPAFIDPQQATERATGREGPPNVESYQVHIRYRPGVRPKMRLIYTNRDGTQTLEIAGVIDTASRHIELVLTCTQVVS